MTAARPIAMLAAFLLVLTLGLAALFYQPVAQHAIQVQNHLWQRLGAFPLSRPDWAWLAEALFLVAAGGTAMVLMRVRVYWAGMFVLGVLVTGFYLALLLARFKGFALDALLPSATLLAAIAAGALARLAQINRLKRELRFAFADSLPRSAVERIARDPALLSLDGETRNVTYLVCGVRGLAELASSFRDSPRAFTRLMEQVLTPLMSQTLRHGGVIGRLTAEGFTAYWNAPLGDPDHALHACEAANGMIVALARVNEQRLSEHRPGEQPIPAVEIGIGIATGPVVAGGFGGHGRLSYSVNGEAVRQAARFQALSRNYGPAVIVAEETRERAAQGFAFLEVDYLAQSAGDKPMRLYAMLENPVARASPKIRALVTFHEHIFQSLHDQQWGKARALVEQCRNLSGACQTLYDLYMTRIRYFESNPPGAGWDGAFRPILK